MDLKQKRRYLRGFFSFLLLVIVAFATYWLVNTSNRNIHAVIPDKVYRSAQLTPVELARVIQQYHIRSVLNLRGAQPTQAWYAAEMAVTQQQGIQHADLAFNAHELPTVAQLQQLAQQLMQLPTPILLHCRQGADRTGLAAAMTLLLFTQPTSAQLWHQVSWLYNVLSPSSVGYQVMRNYWQWCTTSQCQLGQASVSQWLASNPTLHPYRGIAPWGFNQ